MKVMVIVYGECCNHEYEEFYTVLKWASKMDYDEICVVDKDCSQESDEKEFGVKNVESMKFKTEPGVHYSLALNFDNKIGIVRVLNRIKNDNVSFDVGLIWYGDYKPMAY